MTPDSNPSEHASEPEVDLPPGLIAELKRHDAGDRPRTNGLDGLDETVMRAARRHFAGGRSGHRLGPWRWYAASVAAAAGLALAVWGGAGLGPGTAPVESPGRVRGWRTTSTGTDRWTFLTRCAWPSGWRGRPKGLT